VDYLFSIWKLKKMIETMQKPYKKAEVEKILNPIVKQWFFSKFKDFSLPQLYGVMEIHKRNNILVSAPTGATKTLTGFLSILNELTDSAEKGILEDRVYAVYISPLKALSNDVEKNLKQPLKEIEEIAKKKLGIRVAVRTGDTTAYEKSKMVKNPPHILITTPESLALMLTSPKFKENLVNVEWCIIDEIHALAENKRGVHLSLSIERLARLSNHMTRIGLSATVAPIEEIAKFLVGYENKKERPCKIIDIQFIKELDLRVMSPVKDLINTTYHEKHQAMYDLIHKLIQEHRTTLIFTNTRAATERVVHYLKDKYPKKYLESLEEGEGSKIGAHHGSLSKQHRLDIENKLKNGELKTVVSSTSLELGIDIGYIDLVILLGSPKSVARALQRIGRSGHQLHEKAKGRIIVMDRDDLVECSVLLKNAIEKKIDKIHIPANALDVLAQQIFGIAIADKIDIKELFALVKQSYCYHNLLKKDFMEVIKYLSGEYTKLEDRHVYAKIWYDEETGMIGKKGRMARVIYMTNIGTIPDESFVTVKIGDKIVGKIDEAFLERLRPGDIFVLGGSVYKFKFARGMVAQVSASVDRPPTVPSWFSQMLPLSFDLAIEISRFRRLLWERFNLERTKKEILEFINKYLYLDDKAANAIYEYFYEQFNFSIVPHDKKLVVEHFKDRDMFYYIFHSVYGRRVNDCLSRAIAYVIARMEHIDVEIGILDNGFYVGSLKRVNPVKALRSLTKNNFKEVLERAIDKSEVLKRRFRHCAGRSLMIIRNYKGRSKRVGRQQVSSMILMSAVKRINPNFSILMEARREVLEDLMDVDSALLMISKIQNKDIKIEEYFTDVPSPFAFNLVLQGFTEVMKVDDKIEFLKRMHELVLAKIGKKTSDETILEKAKELTKEKVVKQKLSRDQERLIDQLEQVKIPISVKVELIDYIKGMKEFISEDIRRGIYEHKDEIKEFWPKQLSRFILRLIV
jgi:ATP-dependent Lhr-like helicase